MGEVKARDSRRSELVQTGVLSIDRELKGGIPAGCSVLLFSTSLSEKRLLAENFIIAGLKEGETCLYVDFYRSSQLARREFKKFKDFSDDKLVMVDTLSHQLFMTSQEKYSVSNPEDLDSLLDAVKKALKETTPKRIVVDSVEFLADRQSKEDLLSFLESLLRASKESGSTLLLLFLNILYSAKDFSLVKDLVDVVIEIKTEVSTSLPKSSVKIYGSKKLGIPETRWIPFSYGEVLENIEYVPRILVMGLRGSGKKEFMEHLSPEFLDAKGLAGDIDLYSRGVEVSYVEAEVFGEAGTEAYQKTLEVFAKEVDGIILILDSSRPKDTQMAEVVVRLMGKQLPMVVVANKQDLKNSLPPKELGEKMGIPLTIPIIGTIATKGECVWEATLILFFEILRRRGIL